MKFLAVILSCLILTLSAEISGMAFLPLESGGKAEVAQAKCCGCCCECGQRQDGNATDDCDTDTGDSSSHKGCPFCICHTCPGFVAVLAASASAMPVEFRSTECIFIQHKYISPSTDGIWQPPRIA